MLENGLFFVLGFLIAGLLALLVAPAIWRRAVALTRQRIESAIPLSLHEIQADKDQLRAEFAMTQRRLEIDLEKRSGKLDDQTISLNKQRDDILALEDVQREKQDRIGELERELGEKSDKNNDQADELAATTVKLTDLQDRMETRNREFQDLTAKYNSLSSDFDKQKLELVANDAKFTSLQDQMRGERRNVTERSTELERLKSELKLAQHAADAEKEKSTQQDKKLVELRASIADFEARLERRDADIARLREKNPDLAKLDSERGERLDDAVAEAARLKAGIEGLEQERDALKSELEELRNLPPPPPPAPTVTLFEDDIRDDANAVVRSRINELAARVVALTASQEGDDSAITAALSKKIPSLPRADTNGFDPRSGKPKQTSEADVQEPAGGSLSARIKAVQAMSTEEV